MHSARDAELISISMESALANFTFNLIILCGKDKPWLGRRSAKLFLERVGEM